MVNSNEDTEEKEQEKIEINNTKQEIQEITTRCNKCGLCKELDIMWLVNRREDLSIRGQAILLHNFKFDKSIFSFPLTNVCKYLCPFEIDMNEAIKKARKILNLRNRQNDFYKKSLFKIENKENPYVE